MKIKIFIPFTIILLILRYIEITSSLYLLFTLHDISIILLTIIIICTSLYLNRVYLFNLFKRYNNLYIRYLYLIIFVALFMLLLIFSIDVLVTYIDYLIGVSFDNVDILIIRETYGKNFLVVSYLINIMPLLMLYMLYDKNKFNLN